MLYVEIQLAGLGFKPFCLVFPVAGFIAQVIHLLELFPGNAGRRENVVQGLFIVLPERILKAQFLAQFVEDLDVSHCLARRIHDLGPGEDIAVGFPVVRNVIELDPGLCRKHDVRKFRCRGGKDIRHHQELNLLQRIINP